MTRPALDLTADELAVELERAFVSAESVTCEGGVVRFPRAERSVGRLLAEAAGPSRAELDRRIEDDGLWEVLAAVIGREPESLVYVENLGGAPGMSGGCGLLSFVVGDVGYVCWTEDFDLGDDALPLLAAWTPAASETVRDECVALVCEREWERGLPPVVGGTVSGMTGRLTDVAWNTLKEHPEMWDPVVLCELDDLVEHELLDDARAGVRDCPGIEPVLLDAVVSRMKNAWTTLRDDVVEGRLPRAQRRVLFELYAWAIGGET